MRSLNRYSLLTRPEDRVARKFSQQREILQGYFHACFSCACVSLGELKWYFLGFANPPSDQNFKKNLEALRLQINSFNALAAHHEKSRQRILDPKARSLQRH